MKSLVSFYKDGAYKPSIKTGLSLSLTLSSTVLFPTTRTRIPEHCPSYMPNSPLDETCNGVPMLAAATDQEPTLPKHFRGHKVHLFANWRAISRHATMIPYLCVIGSSVPSTCNPVWPRRSGSLSIVYAPCPFKPSLAQ